jgi:ribulose-bisphosphate carboxylase large chain
MVPGVRLVDFELPDSLLASFPGPRIGVGGLRQRFGRSAGPILATALKPMGTPIDKLAAMAHELAINGIHLVKDDHSFATQPFCMFRERVPVIADAIARANAAGGNSVYLPALNVPINEMAAAVEFALESGAGGLLVLPGLFGFDTLRWLAEWTPPETIIMSHPSMLGSLVGDPSLGMAHALALGKLPRLAGADVSIFPNYGGRFSFDPHDCRDVATACLEPLGDLRRAFPAPAGGMTVERVPEMTDFYGPDVCLLIGGGLYRGDIATQVRRMVSAIED